MKRFFTIKFVFIVFTFVFAANVIFISHEQRCIASASHTLPVDYCLQMDIAITNDGASNLTNYPVRVLVNEQNLISSNYLDSRGWDLLPVIGSINNEINNLQQDITTTNAEWWFTIPDLPAGETRIVRSYMGNNDVRRDQGFNFSTGDYESIQTPDNAALDVTDNLEIHLTITRNNTTSNSEYLIEKWAGSVGYYISELSSGSNIRFQIDNGNCDMPWNSAWDNTRQTFIFSYIAGAGVDTWIDVVGGATFQCDIDQGAININAEPLNIGWDGSSNNLNDTIIHNVRIVEAGTDAVSYGFDPDSMSETVSINPFQGTINDYSGNGLTATYTINAPQTDLSYSIGVPELIDLADFPGSPDDVNTIVGPGVPDSFLTPVPAVSSGPLYDLVINPLQDSASASGLPPQGLIAAVAWAVGLLLGIFTWRLTGGFIPAVIMSLGLPVVIVVTLGWVPQWWLITWGLAIIVTWLATRRSQQSA